MKRAIVALALAALVAAQGCGSAPPKGAVDEGTKAVTNNPELSGTAELQYGRPRDEGPWVSDRMTVTFRQMTLLRCSSGTWSREN